MSLYDASVPQVAKMLRNLESWLDKAAANAESRAFDPEVLTTCRLAPDQYSLARQVMSACDAGKFAVARTSGKTAPVHPDTETTLAELKARIHSCLEFVESVGPEELEGAATRTITLPFLGGRTMIGSDYLFQMALPNFYFHLSMVYAILRHNGVPLGKMDFIGSLTLRDA